MRTFKLVYINFILIFSLSSVVMAQSQMIADITENVETEFATYQPYLVEFTPSVPSFTIDPDFANVNYFTRMPSTLNETEMNLLAKNYFIVKKSPYKQLFDIYNECTWHGTPVFVTTDAVLHTFHVLYDKLLAEIEIQKFNSMLRYMTDTLLANAKITSQTASNSAVQEAALKNLAFLYVAKKLLDGDTVTVPESVSALVDSELVLIQNTKGYAFSPILGTFSKMDYSQFKVRGHYTQSDELKAYFKTMMWYGWTIMTMEPDLFGEIAERHTLQALMLVQMIFNLESDEQPLLELWKNIYEPTVFFVGKTDDPNIHDYKTIADQVYGENFLSLDPDELADSASLTQFMAKAQELPEPKIPNWIYGTFITYKGFRFMGQRFIPDSYMLAHLIDPYVRDRFFPMGLDIMSILGSERALTIADSVYNETSFTNYTETINQFKQEYKALSAETWAQNLYWNWLYCLMPLFYEKGPGYPLFMQSPAWMDKELMTALASWAELRHDTILYAKQSTSPCGITPGPPKGYVEPNPYLYARLASLTKFAREGLGSRNLFLDEFTEKFALFEDLLIFLKRISIKELENTPLTDTEYDDIYCFGKVMEKIVSEVKDPSNPWESDADDMAVVADVHTDSNSDKCLEEGVGYPLEIYVIVNEGGDTRMTRGAIFSYYEFKQPISDRLTDEQWREMLVSETPPQLPKWMSSFIANEYMPYGFYDYAPENLFHKDFVAVEQDDKTKVPQKLNLLQNYPNPFNPETVIQFELPEPGYIKLSIYNMLGRQIKTLFDGYKSAGFYQETWNGLDALGKQVPSGVYFYRLEVNRQQYIKKMMMVR